MQPCPKFRADGDVLPKGESIAERVARGAVVMRMSPPIEPPAPEVVWLLYAQGKPSKPFPRPKTPNLRSIVENIVQATTTIRDDTTLVASRVGWNGTPPTIRV